MDNVAPEVNAVPINIRISMIRSVQQMYDLRHLVKVEADQRDGTEAAAVL